jgi:hypothetical protein
MVATGLLLFLGMPHRQDWIRMQMIQLGVHHFSYPILHVQIQTFGAPSIKD